MVPEADPPDSPTMDGMSVALDIKASLSRNADERLHELFACEYKPLVSYVVGLGLTRVEAEDVAAQAFAQLLQRKDLGSISVLSAYVYKTAKNITCNRYSHLAMQQRHGPFLEAGHNEESPSLEPGLMEQQRSTVVRHAIAQLPVKCRTCMALRFWHELTYPQIVEWYRRRGIDINEKTVRRNVERGMEAIRIAVQAAEAPAEEARK